MKYILVIIVLFTEFATPAIAQHKFTGVVSSAKSHESLPSANILVKDTYRGTVTNKNGTFSISIPDSLMPVTLIVRYIGYKNSRRTLTKSSKTKQDFILQPSVAEMEEIVVTDEDPAMRIMRQVIKHKQQWRKELQTYQAHAYTRQVLSNDTSIVSITESASDVFWDIDKGHREILKSKRQTANIEATDNIAAVSYSPNLYDDNIEIASFSLVGVTNPNALQYYNFKLLGQTSIDDQTVYKIAVGPDRKLQPLFKGTIYVLKKDYALLKVRLTTNDVVDFPNPVQSFDSYYNQQFSNFGKSLWLPVNMKISGDLKISMMGLEFPKMKFKQLSRISNYNVNVALPDSLYRDDKSFAIDSLTVRSDSLINNQITSVPLSEDEKDAYNTIDSTATLQKVFKPTGFLAPLVNSDNDDESDSGLLSFTEEIPGKITPDLAYNRVDQAHLGLTYNIDMAERFSFSLGGGYSTGYEKWSYLGGITAEWLQKDWLNAELGWEYSAATATQGNTQIYTPLVLIIPNLMGSDGYMDYYRSEGWSAFSEFKFPEQELSLSVGFNNKRERSLSTTTAYDILGTRNYQQNPAVDEGRLHSIDITAGFKLNNGYNFGVTGRKYAKVSFEHSSDALGSDFSFDQYTTSFSWSFPTFYKRRLLPNTLDIHGKAGTYSGTLPRQKLGIVDVGLARGTPFGVMKTAHGRPFKGSRYYAIQLEHNFRTIPFEILGLTPLVERDIGIIAFAGVAQTWPQYSKQGFMNRIYNPKSTDGTHWEVGASLNGIFGLFRLDFATRLDDPSLVVGVSVARLF